jgi:hypothetical protein
MVTLIQNPFHNPISDVYKELVSTKWEIPFIPQIIKSLVLFLLLIVLPLIYISIGVISQISELLWDLMEESKRKIKGNSLIDASGYAIANAVYFILFVPFWLVQLPFLFISWLIRQYKTLVYAMVVIIALLFVIRWQYINIKSVYHTISNDSIKADTTLIDSIKSISK